MPEFGPPIAELRVGTRVEQLPVQVLEATAGKTRDSKPFARYVFRDRTGTIAGIRWDWDLRDGENGAVALVTGNISEYQQSLQLRVNDLQLLDDPHELVLERVVAPQDPELLPRLRTILGELQAGLPPLFWRLFREALGDDPFDSAGPFWTYAAAQSRHHACRAGLAWHVLTMAAHVAPMAEHYPGLDTELLTLAVLLHDLGKIDCYRMHLTSAERLPIDILVGHTSYSLMRAQRAVATLAGEGLDLDPKDIENLFHCIASHHGRPEWGAIVEPKTAEAHALHALDLLDSQTRGELDRAGQRDRPERGRPATATAEDEPPDDPFLVDEDDPFAADEDAEPEPADLQRRLF